MAKSTTSKMPDTRGPRFGAVPAENDTYRGAIYGVLASGEPKLLDARRPTCGEAIEDAWKPSSFYGNHYEGRGESPWLRRASPIYFR